MTRVTSNYCALGMHYICDGGFTGGRCECRCHKVAGEVQRTKARTTGATVVVLDYRRGGEWLFSEEEGGRWCAACLDHSRLVQTEKREYAVYSMHHPELWCGVCNGQEDE